jgi:hypothetical protein
MSTVPPVSSNVAESSRTSGTADTGAASRRGACAAHHRRGAVTMNFPGEEVDEMAETYWKRSP